MKKQWYVIEVQGERDEVLGFQIECTGQSTLRIETQGVDNDKARPLANKIVKLLNGNHSSQKFTNPLKQTGLVY